MGRGQSGANQRLLTDRNVHVNMNGEGAWSDISPMESFPATLDRKCAGERIGATRAHARTPLRDIG
jgi:hypothetical protein